MVAGEENGMVCMEKKNLVSSLDFEKAPLIVLFVGCRQRLQLMLPLLSLLHRRCQLYCWYRATSIAAGETSSADTGENSPADKEQL